MSETETVDCELCGPSRTRELSLLRIPHPEGDLVLRRCLSCGLVYQSPRLTQAQLAKLLDESYFEEGGYSGYHHARSYFDEKERAEKLAFSDRILDDMAEFRELSGCRLLEVGAAGGHFLLAARARGCEVKGVELSDYASSQARERYELDVVQGQLEEAALPSGAFDVVYVNDLLEHAPQPLRFLDEVKRILSPDGLFYAVVPTYVSSLPTRVFAPLWSLRRWRRRLGGGPAGPTFLQEPFHIYEFEPATLQLLFRRGGYDVLAMTSSMPSIQSGAKSSVRGAAARLKLSLMRGYAWGVRRGLMWGERTRIVGRPEGSGSTDEGA